MVSATHTQIGFRPVFILMLACLAILSSCASKKKVISSSANTGVAYQVTSVDVQALENSDFQFANQLGYSLRQSVGRPENRLNKKVSLYVSVLPLGPLNKPSLALAQQILTLGSATANVNVSVVDYATGEILQAARFTASSTSDDPSIASVVIEEKLIAQIRVFLGLNLTPPRQVSNYKNTNRVSVVIDDDFTDGDEIDPAVLKPKALVSDPLLNGEITSETSVSDLVTETKEADKEMLSEAKEMKKVVTEEMVKQEPYVAPVEEKVMPKVQAPTAIETDDDDGELCIVTVDNDCLGVPGN